MTPLRFTEADADRAYDDWGCNCGPTAFAAIAGLTLEETRRAFPNFPGYTNPSMMLDALGRAGIRHFARDSLAFPIHGVARIQFEGPWTDRKVNNKRWAYRYTHWVGARRVRSDITVFDVNALDRGGWLPFETWSSEILPGLIANHKRATGGWHVTHAIEVKIAAADIRMAG